MTHSPKNIDTTPRFATKSFGNLRIVIATYATGAKAIELYDDGDEFVACLSVNLPEFAHLLEESEFFAKTWSENEFIAADALRSGLFEDTGRRTGFLRAPIWKMCFPSQGSTRC